MNGFCSVAILSMQICPERDEDLCRFVVAEVDTLVTVEGSGFRVLLKSKRRIQVEKDDPPNS